jgi:molybdopterin synthase sulfur carrier subunit
MVVKYFSWIKEHIGKAEEVIDLPEDITNIKELISYLENLNDDYRLAFEKKNLIKIAINKSYSSLDDKIDNNDEIAFFPPVTGG